MTTNSTSRFSNRVQDYVKYRPHYPEEMIDRVIELAGIEPGDVVADIGSGTGISSLPFLDRGFDVVGVEPNAAMREAAEEIISLHLAEQMEDAEIQDGTDPIFISVEETAEDTKIDEQSVDLVIAGQAFHWFDRVKFRQECKRMLKPGAKVALFWNERLIDVNDFLREYEELIKRYATDYSKIDHRRMDDEVITEFLGRRPHIETFPNVQVLDFDGLYGRLASSSYIPAPDDPAMQEMKRELREIFDRYQQNGTIELLYETKLYVSEIT
jgi:SAM-dependent methyltransferase